METISGIFGVIKTFLTPAMEVDVTVSLPILGVLVGLIAGYRIVRRVYMEDRQEVVDLTLEKLFSSPFEIKNEAVIEKFEEAGLHERDKEVLKLARELTQGRSSSPRAEALRRRLGLKEF